MDSMALILIVDTECDVLINIFFSELNMAVTTHWKVVESQMGQQCTSH